MRSPITYNHSHIGPQPPSYLLVWNQFQELERGWWWKKQGCITTPFFYTKLVLIQSHLLCLNNYLWKEISMKILTRSTLHPSTKGLIRFKKINMTVGTLLGKYLPWRLSLLLPAVHRSYPLHPDSWSRFPPSPLPALLHPAVLPVVHTG